MFEECPFCSSRFRRFAVCFSLMVLPFFLTFALVVESLDMIEPSWHRSENVLRVIADGGGREIRTLCRPYALLVPVGWCPGPRYE